MSKKSILEEIRYELGQVPTFMGDLPEDVLEEEWKIFKRNVMSSNTAIPPKYRELIGIGVAAANQCWYCANFHTGMAKLYGATDEEVKEASYLAKFGTGWSKYLNGTVYDRELFMKELTEIGEFVASHQHA